MSNGMTYMSVERPTIQAAFAKAHRLANNANVPQAERAEFLKIARLIWNACGEQHGNMPAPGSIEFPASITEAGRNV